jgi:hypothetical protein
MEFSDQEFDKGTDGIFRVSSTEKFTWPTSTLSFFAISPDCTLDFDNAAKPVFKNFAPATKIREQVDIVYATNKGSRSDFATQVPLKFNHALSEIVVYAKNDNKSYNVYVKGYRIGYVNRQGSFTFPEAVQNTNLDDLSTYEQATGTWSGLTYTSANSPKGNNYSSEFISNAKTKLLSSTPDRIYVESTGTVDGVTDPGEGAAMIIPQNGAKWVPEDPNKTLGRYLAVLVQINYRNTDGTDGAPVYPYVTSEGTRVSYAGLPFYYGYAAVPISENWEPGKRYTYYLDFSNGCGYVDPELPSAYDPSGTGDDDKNGDGIDDSLDKDGDGVPDDENGDGIPDAYEKDTDGDGIPDTYDEDKFGPDEDGDGIPDDKDVDGKDEDGDGNNDDGTDPYSPNDPIIGHEISFKVVVTDWVEAIQTNANGTVTTEMNNGAQTQPTTATTNP